MSQMSLAIAIFTKSGMGARMSEGSRKARGEDSTAAGASRSGWQKYCREDRMGEEEKGCKRGEGRMGGRMSEA